MTRKISSAPSCADPFEPGTMSLDAALARIESRIVPLRACERLPIRDCLGRVNDAAVKSPHDVPPRPNSAMDGYALAIASLASDSVTELDDIGTAFAGRPFTGSCGPGQCVRIMTGALIPDGTDAVVMQEQAETGDDGRVRVDGDHRVGENIRQAGEDVQQGAVVIDAHARLSPADLGVLASLGIGHLQVRRKPVVAFFGGKFVDDMPGTRFGHASVIVRPGSGSTREKTRLFRKAGVTVVEVYSDIPMAVKERLSRKSPAKKKSTSKKKAAQKKKSAQRRKPSVKKSAARKASRKRKAKGK